MALLAGALGVAAFLGSARDGSRRLDERAFDVIRAKEAEAAPSFELEDLNGRPVRLEDFRGRVVVLGASPAATKCGKWDSWRGHLGDRDLVVVAVNYQEALGPVQAFVRELGVSFPVLLDPAGAVAALYRVQALPSTYLIDRDGVLAGLAVGYRAWEAPEAGAYLRELMTARR
ncbi:MAG: peroxiredoxin family protein [Candidatus Rokuibacteriota bacterium]